MRNRKGQFWKEIKLMKTKYIKSNFFWGKEVHIVHCTIRIRSLYPLPLKLPWTRRGGGESFGQEGVVGNPLDKEGWWGMVIDNVNYQGKYYCFRKDDCIGSRIRIIHIQHFLNIWYDPFVRLNYVFTYNFPHKLIILKNLVINLGCASAVSVVHLPGAEAAPDQGWPPEEEACPLHPLR